MSFLLGLEEDAVEYGIKGMKILFYGGNTLGKTPQSMKFPKPLLLMGESGGSALKGHKVDIPDKKTFLAITNELINKKTLPEMQEKYQTIIIDCIEDIVGLYEDAICKEYGVKDVSQVQQADKGNPNGYSAYRREFKSQLNKLTKLGYTVIFISHEDYEEVRDHNDQKIGEFIVPKGSKGKNASCRFIRDICDFRFYIKSNGVDPDTNETIMSTAWCVQTSEFYAGSRFAVQSKVNPFTSENIIEAMEKAQRRSAEEQESGLKEFSLNTSDYTRKDYLTAIKPYCTRMKDQYAVEVANIVESQLGEVKLAATTDDHLTELDVIYTKLMQFACDRGIVIE